MNQTVIRHFHSWGYQSFKYLVYALLSLNVYIFFSEEWLASKVIFAAGISLENIIEGFSSTIDTAAWVLLLLLFELETYVIPDDKIKGLTKWTIHGIRALCYIVIVYAFYGYLSKLGLFSHFSPQQIADICALSSDWKVMDTLNVYNPITKENCALLAKSNEALWVYPELKIVSTETVYKDVKMLAWVDVINSGAWLTVVAMLEVDVRMQLGQLSSKWWTKYNIFIKGSIYSVLLLAAIYWGVTGNFIEFWDAFLWLLAFFLIEMNMFEWHAETAQGHHK
ncbi:hypothetical protein AAD001_07555 [Colwelliaceae bacterium 6471]